MWRAGAVERTPRKPGIRHSPPCHLLAELQVPNSLVTVDALGRIVFRAQVVIQPDQAAVNAALGTGEKLGREGGAAEQATAELALGFPWGSQEVPPTASAKKQTTLCRAGVFSVNEPSLQVNTAGDSMGGVLMGAETAPAIATSSPTQPLRFQGPVTATSLDVGAGTVSGAMLLAAGPAGVVRGTTVSGGTIQASASITSPDVTATVLQTVDGGVTITGGSVTATTQLAGQTLLVQDAARGACRLPCLYVGSNICARPPPPPPLGFPRSAGSWLCMHHV